MKKALLLLGLIAAGATTLNAQSNRTVLYEEFTGENCPPCAQTNPPLWNLLNQDSSEAIFIIYMSPIPSPGPLYNENTAVAQNRLAYYSVGFAPWGEMDGALPPGVTSSQQNPNHPYYVINDPSTVTQAQAVAAPFNIEFVSNSIDSTSGLSATIKVTATQAESGTSLKLRAALVENLNFSTPPGTNGETDFEHVVRKMYPSPDGQAIPNTWASGESHTYTISGAVPSYVNLSDEHFIVVWVQDDGTKKVLQAARSEEQTTGVHSVALNNANLSLYPNPVTNNLTVNMTLTKSAAVNFSVVNLLGQKISTVVKDLTKGDNKVSLNTEALAPGVYFLNVATGAGSIQRKFIKK